MKNTRTESRTLSLKTAGRQTKAFRKAFPEATKAFYFGRNAIETLLAHPDATGVRYYHGLDARQHEHMILVAVDAMGNDIINGDIFQRAFPCPPICADYNVLNSASVLTMKRKKADRAFTGMEDHSFTLAEAADLTSRFQSTKTERMAGGFLAKEEIEHTLAQDGAVGIRFYNILDQDNNQGMLIVAATSDMNDLLTAELSYTLSAPAALCGEENPLNAAATVYVR